MRYPILLLCSASFLTLTSLASADTGSANRGLWFWYTPSSPYGAANIVGNSTHENQTIAQFQQFGISHLYGSYSDLPQNSPAALAAWNQKLSAHSISSDLLLSEDSWIFPTHRPGLLADIQSDLINFNLSQPAASQFHGLHLDIEPQGLTQWSTWSPTDKRNALNLLLNTFQDVRTYLNANGASSVPVYADLPVWFDSLSAIGWSSTADRAAWFSDLGQCLAGISLMAYERPTFSSVDSSVQYELANFPAISRVALEADVGPDQTWANLNAMFTVADQLESAYGPSAGIDIHDYALLEQAAAIPEPASLTLLTLASTTLLTRRRKP